MSKYSTFLFPSTNQKLVGESIRFAVYGDILPGEARHLNEISRKQSQASYASIKLAQQISRDQDISIKEAVTLLSNLDDEKNQDLLYNYAEMLNEINASGLDELAIKIGFVTVLMKARGEIKTADGSWAFTPDWSEEDTESMPPAILKECFEFIIEERDGKPEAVVGNESAAPVPATS